MLRSLSGVSTSRKHDREEKEEGFRSRKEGEAKEIKGVWAGLVPAKRGEEKSKIWGGSRIGGGETGRVSAPAAKFLLKEENNNNQSNSENGFYFQNNLESKLSGKTLGLKKSTTMRGRIGKRTKLSCK